MNEILTFDYLKRLREETDHCIAEWEHGRLCPKDHVCLTPSEYAEALMKLKEVGR